MTRGSLNSRTLPEIYVAEPHEAKHLVAKHEITHVIGLVSARRSHPDILAHPDIRVHQDRHLCVTMSDIFDIDHSRAPQEHQVRQLLEFTDSLPEEARLLIYGDYNSRLPSACALAVFVQKLGVEDPNGILDTLNELVRHPTPNVLFAYLADQVLDTEGGEVSVNRLANVAYAESVNRKRDRPNWGQSDSSAPSM